MTAHRLLALTAATGALAVAAPAAAHPDTAGDVVFESVPVVQPTENPAPANPPVVDTAERVTIYEADIEPVHSLPPPPPIPPVPPVHHNYSGPLPHAVVHHPTPQHGFDREAWLDECRDRIQGVRRKDRAAVIGGLLGAAAGGVIGNRAWDSERLAGTLLGAGVGGLAGLAIGSAIAAAGDRKREDECAWHLDRYMASRHNAPAPAWGGYPANVYGYGYGYPAVTYVPVLVQVPQRAIVREYVTEEWVDVPAATRTPAVPRGKIVPQRAPQSGKRTKLIKTK